jgi:hypothetical protein
LSTPSELTALEIAVLEAMCESTPGEADALRCQIENAEVLKRENTGHGFLTRMKPKKSTYLIKTRVISRVAGKLEGFDNPMLFALFMQDGQISLLDGSAVDEDTSNADFTTIKFTIEPF